MSESGHVLNPLAVNGKFTSASKTVSSLMVTLPLQTYLQMRNSKEDCCLLAAASGGKVTFKKNIPKEDEGLTLTLESDVVMDWLDALGGSKLVHHVFSVFFKELETESLADLRQAISVNLSNLL